MGSINLIVARSRNNVIGNADGIPWHIPGEQAQFKELTTGNAVIMGRKTYEDIGHPLPNRLNIVVSNTRQYDYCDANTTLMTADSLGTAIAMVPDHKDIYIAGGRRLYEEAIGIVDKMYITEVNMEIPVDDSTVFFPDFDEDEFEFERIIERFTRNEPKTISYQRTVYTRCDISNLKWKNIKTRQISGWEEVERCRAVLPKHVGYLTLTHRRSAIDGMEWFTIYYHITATNMSPSPSFNGMETLPYTVKTMDEAKAMAGELFIRMISERIDDYERKMFAIRHIKNICKR